MESGCLCVQDKTDCNGDGKLDCVDYAYIHANGGYNCANKAILSTEFYKKFNTCWKVVQAATENKAPVIPIAATGVVPPSA